MKRFVTEDPIRFAAGDVNFYAYVGNNPVNFIDPLGLFIAEEMPMDGYGGSFGAIKDFLNNYIDMRLANNKKQDKYFHCKANCEAAKRGSGGVNAAEDMSNLREWMDLNWKGDTKEDCEADQEANAFGRNEALKNKGASCSEICKKYRPNGLSNKY